MVHHHLLLFLSGVWMILTFPQLSSSLLQIYSKILQDQILPSNYDKSEAPSVATSQYAGDATVINFGIYPIKILSLSPREMTMTIEMGIFLAWTDGRLNKTIISERNKRFFQMPKEITQNLWIPRFTLRNCVGCKEFIISSFNNIIYIIAEQQLILSLRGTYIFTCDFDLSFYPFDTQTCSIEIMRDVSQPTTLVFIPSQFPFSVPPEFHCEEKSQSPCKEDYRFTNITESDCVKYNFVLRRSRIRPILMAIVPSTLIVILSWISFWLDVETAAARVSLGLTSMLTLITHFNIVQQHLPAVSTIMAQDVWMFTCIFMVFASLLEFPIASYKFRMSKQKSSRAINQLCGNGTSSNQESCKVNDVLTIFSFPSKKLDELSRVMFPCIFLAFNVAFWVYYY